MNVLDRIHRDLAEARDKGDWKRVIELRHELGKLLETTLNLVRQRASDGQQKADSLRIVLTSNRDTQ